MKPTNKNMTRTYATLFIALLFGLTINTGVAQQSEALQASYSLNESNDEPRVETNFGFTILSEPLSIGTEINTQFIELKPIMAPGGKRLFFSRLPYQASIGGNKYNEDIWYADFDGTIWSEPRRLPGELNNAGPNFVNGISSTGDTLILGNQYLKKGKMRAGLSYSVNTNGEWSTPVAIKIKNDYNLSEHANHYASLTHGVIISAIERNETLGSRDLYVSLWNGKSATEPMNMGTVINTDLEESSPYLYDNKTLFFASKGHNGLGGFDIFVTTRLDESWTNWSEPKNLGSTINGLLDDEHFTITSCKKFGVFSKQVSSNNVDLFLVSLEAIANGNKITEAAPLKKATINVALGF